MGRFSRDVESELVHFITVSWVFLLEVARFRVVAQAKLVSRSEGPLADSSGLVLNIQACTLTKISFQLPTACVSLLTFFLRNL